MTSRPLRPSAPPAPGVPADAAVRPRPHLPPVPATRSTDRRRKAPLAWLPWLLLGLLALTLLAVALLAHAAGRSSGGTDDAPAQAAQSGERAGGALSAGGTGLLGLPDGRLGSLAGQRASGTARVESVVADEGFWVGSDATRRVFVLLTPQARRSAGESGFQVRPGQTVTLEGSVKQSSAPFAQAVGVTSEEGAGQLVAQGGYVEATEVRLAP